MLISCHNHVNTMASHANIMSCQHQIKLMIHSCQDHATSHKIKSDGELEMMIRSSVKAIPYQVSEFCSKFPCFHTIPFAMSEWKDEKSWSSDKSTGEDWNERPWKESSWSSDKSTGEEWGKQSSKNDPSKGALKDAGDSEDDGAAGILSYMRENAASNKDGGPYINCDHKEYEDSILKKIDQLSGEEREKFLNITETKGRGTSPMWYAVWTNSERVLDRLIEMRAHISHPCLSRGRTPLWEAASQGHEEIARKLIEHRADLNTTTHCGARRGDSNGASVIGIAKARKRDELVTLLVKAGADAGDSAEPLALDMTALRLAARGDSPQRGRSRNRRRENSQESSPQRSRSR